MKKRISLFLALALIVVCTGCGGAPAPTPAPTEAAAAPVPAAAPAAETRTEAEPTQENKVMVVYFSVTGTTRGVAEKLAFLYDQGFRVKADPERAAAFRARLANLTGTRSL